MNQKDYFRSEAKSLKLNFNIDYKGMLQEAINLRDKFVTHRPSSYNHKGWKSICLHGVSESHTGAWMQYGFESAIAAGNASTWTEASKECPITMDFLLNQFPSKKFARVRFMLLEAGGRIDEHVDSSVPILENINISLSNPVGCDWVWGDGEKFFMEPGSSYAMNIHYPHSVVNNSNEDRYHLIIHRHDSTLEWKQMIDQCCIEQNVTGEYFTHSIEV